MTNEELYFKLLSRTELTEDGCYLFSATNKRGHGQISYKLKTYGVHRLSAMIFLGLDLGDKTQQANHKCKNRNCWNPEHLYVGNQSENMFDAIEAGTYKSPYADITHCKRGHALEGDNVLIRKNDGGRQCKKCQRIRMDEYQQRQQQQQQQQKTEG
jgi:hypothetical protein